MTDARNTNPPKTCYSCKTSYPNTSDYFHVDKTHADGYCSRCKACATAYWHAPHRHEANLERAAKYRAANREYLRRYARRYQAQKRARETAAKFEAVQAMMKRGQNER